MSRHQRNREATFKSIVVAAETLMRERGVEAITIHDITEKADVGHGSFYVHFDSKNDVLVPIARRHASELNERITLLTQNIPDPAQAFAVSVRHMMRAIANDPLWSFFIFRSGLPNEKLREGVAEGGREDLVRGINSGAFLIKDLDTVMSFLLGALAGVLDDVHQGILGEEAFDAAAELTLRVVGIAPDTAAKLSRMPLPALPKAKRRPAASESTPT